MTIKEFLFSNKYGSLRYKVIRFFKHKLPFTKTWNEYHNPWYHWWLARKYFKRPKAHFHCGKMIWFFGFPCRRDYLNPIIDFRMSSLGWKNKFYDYRHEWDPYISVVFFRKWQLLWIFNWVNKNDHSSHIRSMATWEAILDHVFENKDVDWCVKHHIWSSDFGDINVKIDIRENLKWTGTK